MARYTCSVDLRPRGHVDIALAGEIDYAATEDLDRIVGDTAAAHPTTIAVDLHAVSFFCAAGLSFLIRLKDLALEQGATLTVAPVSRSVQHLLELLELTADLNGTVELSRLAAVEDL